VRAQEKINSSKMLPPAGAQVIWWVVVNNEVKDALRKIKQDLPPHSAPRISIRLLLICCGDKVE
jgi:hypothetical protein